MMNHINEKTIKSVASYRKWVDTIEEALSLKKGPDYHMPTRMHVDFGNDTLLLMPCIGNNYMATKLVSLFPGNRAKGKSPLQGIVILSKRDTGEPLATLDGAALTAMRTAAVGGFAVRHLASPGASTLGVIGMGTQGLHQAMFACSEREISTVNIYDNNKEACESFTRNFSKEYPGIKINIAENNSKLCEESELIITATNSTAPVLPDDPGMLKGKTIIGIGSYKKNMREFPDSLYGLCDKIFIDSYDGLKESGDLIYPIEKGLKDKNDFISASELPGKDIDKNETNVFKSVGTALFDLSASILVYESMKE